MGGRAALARSKWGEGREIGMIEGVGAASARHRSEGGKENEGG